MIENFVREQVNITVTVPVTGHNRRLVCCRKRYASTLQQAINSNNTYNPLNKDCTFVQVCK